MELYLAGFLFGLFGSMHCVGMCGPIALALPAQDKPVAFWLSRINYNLGRSITYALMGGVLGLVGFGAYLAGYQEIISVVSGALIVTVALAALIGGRTNWMHIKPMWLPVESLKKGMGRLLKINSPSGVFGLGLLNGFLPCGFVYVALTGALASGSAINGMVYMFLFGMGTFPIMFAVSASNKLISIRMRTRMQKAVPYVAIALGIILILRGLSLGIPFLSPELENMATGGGMMMMGGEEGASCH